MGTTTTTTRTARARALTAAQRNEIRAELDRMRSRYAADDARHDALARALDRLDDGSYGSCAGCGEPIPYGRLSVMPETVHCVACGPRA